MTITWSMRTSNHAAPQPTASERLRTQTVLFIAAALALCLVGLIRWSAGAQGATTVAGHNGIVAESPRQGLPQILDGRIHDVVEHDGRLILGGSFTRIRVANGTEVAQPYLLAIDAETGAFVDDFRPVINDEVLAVEVGYDNGTVFIGGRFTDINGSTRNRLAEVRVLDGAPTSWVSNATGSVTAIDLTEQGRLFVGGSFTKIRGKGIAKVAELSPTTGKPNEAFDFTFSGTAGRRSGGLTIRTVEATPDGTRLLVIHSGRTIDGLDRRGAAIFDISGADNPFLTPFSNVNFDAALRYKGYAPVTGDLSPDGSFFVMVSTGFVMAFPTNGGPDQAELWHQTTHDSIFAAAISDSAVYIGGHFCHMTSGPGETVREGNYTNRLCPIDIVDPTFRKQVAALNPADGTPLDWDPGSNSFVGVRMLEVLDGGLALGHDGMWTGGTETGYFAYYPAPTSGSLDCSISRSAAGHPVLSWVDIAGQSTFAIRRDGRWVATVTNGRTFEDTAVTTTAPSYVVRYSKNGQRHDLQCGQPPIGAAPVASQSSVAFGGEPSRAVDGVADGVYRNGSITHTATEFSPWWQVDLQTSRSIQSVSLWNREDCCANRLNNFYVLSSNADMSGRSLDDLLLDPQVQVLTYEPGTAGRETTITTSAQGRFVMVRLADTGILSIAEVVIG